MAFNIGFYAYAILGHAQANQLLPHLMMEQFDTIANSIRVITLCSSKGFHAYAIVSLIS